MAVLDLHVATDDGQRPATKFFVNGAVVDRSTPLGATAFQGTTTHRVKVVDGTAIGSGAGSRDIRPATASR